MLGNWYAIDLGIDLYYCFLVWQKSHEGFRMWWWRCVVWGALLCFVLCIDVICCTQISADNNNDSLRECKKWSKNYINIDIVVFLIMWICNCIVNFYACLWFYELLCILVNFLCTQTSENFRNFDDTTVPQFSMHPNFRSFPMILQYHNFWSSKVQSKYWKIAEETGPKINEKKHTCLYEHGACLIQATNETVWCITVPCDKALMFTCTWVHDTHHDGVPCMKWLNFSRP